MCFINSLDSKTKVASSNTLVQSLLGDFQGDHNFWEKLENTMSVNIERMKTSS
jgi:hypothetical protein